MIHIDYAREMYKDYLEDGKFKECKTYRDFFLAMPDTGNDFANAWAATSLMHVATADKVFYIKKDISKAFTLTDVKIPPELIKFPYDSFFLALEEPMYGVKILDNNKPYPVTGVYVKIEDNYVIRIMLTYGPNSKLIDHNLYFNIGLIEGVDVMDTLEQWLTKDRFAKVNHGNRGAIEDGIANNINDNAIVTSMSYVMNFLLYLSTTGGKVVNPNKKKVDMSKPKQVKKATKPLTTYTIIGDGYSLPSEPTRTRKGTKVGCTFWVRGHWRNQACGKDRVDRKLIFIEPHIKGSGKMKEARYVVK